MDVRDDVVHPLPPKLVADVCRLPMRPLNPRKPGGVIGFPGQLTVEFPVSRCGLFAHDDPRRTQAACQVMWTCLIWLLAPASRENIEQMWSLHWQRVTKRRQRSTCQCPHSSPSSVRLYLGTAGGGHIHRFQINKNIIKTVKGLLFHLPKIFYVGLMQPCDYSGKHMIILL